MLQCDNFFSIYVLRKETMKLNLTQVTEFVNEEYKHAVGAPFDPKDASIIKFTTKFTVLPIKNSKRSYPILLPSLH